MNPMRIAVNILGAGAGIWVYERYIVPSLPQNIVAPNPGFGFDDVLAGAAAFGGAFLANSLYSKVSG